jgi:hypothetical protein
MLCILDKGEGKKMPSSIIRRTCAFDTKIRVFWGWADLLSAYVGRNKKFFRKIEKCRFLLPFCVENQAIFARIAPDR